MTEKKKKKAETAENKKEEKQESAKKEQNKEQSDRKEEKAEKSKSAKSEEGKKTQDAAAQADQQQDEKGSDQVSEESEQKADAVKVKRKKKRRIRRQVQKGQAFVKSTYNNTMVTLCDLHGNTLAWSSSGLLGFKGAKKATTYAASQVVNDVTEKVQKYGLKDLEVFVKGVGSGRESAIRTLAQKGFNLNMIKDRTPIPHNGCRPPKPRRV
ncbi:MAG: 30S ribosomal protein S11 [Candidatus Moranbacteria bacterium]|nr:30S ribosomal protein S11 [Candidatus Moranbacteria bacterium]